MTIIEVPATDLSRLDDQARDYISQAKAPSTLRAYRSDWGHFTAWAVGHGRAFLPALPETVAFYVTDLASTRAVSTITRRLAAISVAHQAAGHDSPSSAPSVRAVMQGVRRAKGVAQVGKAATLTADIRAMVAALPTDKLIGVRNRALLLVGFAGALRRSELVGLDFGDAEFVEGGVTVEAQGRAHGLAMQERVMTAQEAADYLHISVRLLRRTIKPYRRFGAKGRPEATDARVALGDGLLVELGEVVDFFAQVVESRQVRPVDEVRRRRTW